jgi:hypothetical protein
VVGMGSVLIVLDLQAWVEITFYLVILIYPNIVKWLKVVISSSLIFAVVCEKSISVFAKIAWGEIGSVVSEEKILF